MPVRDDLRKEVAELQAKQLEDGAQREQDEQYYQEHMKPTMLRAHEFFSEVLTNINIVSPKIYARYPLDPTRERGVRLRQTEYKFRADDGRNPREIDVLCKAILDKPHDFFVGTSKRADKHQALLDQYDCYYHRKNYLDKLYNVRGARFFLEGPMRVHFRIQAHAVERLIHIDMQNFEDQPRRRYSYAPGELTEELFDRLASMLVREERYLIPPDVGVVARDDLRRQLQQEQLHKEEDLADALLEREIAQQEEKDALLVNRAKRAFVIGTRDAIEAVKRRLGRADEIPKDETDTPPAH